MRLGKLINTPQEIGFVILQSEEADENAFWE